MSRVSGKYPSDFENTSLDRIISSVGCPCDSMSMRGVDYLLRVVRFPGIALKAMVTSFGICGDSKGAVCRAVCERNHKYF